MKNYDLEFPPEPKRKRGRKRKLKPRIDDNMTPEEREWLAEYDAVIARQNDPLYSQYWPGGKRRKIEY